MKRALEPGTLAIAKARSGNAKIGDAATTYVEQRSCPSACVFKDGGGCYAEEGPLGKFVTAPLNRAASLWASATPEEIAEAEANAIDRMEVVPGFPLRLHTVGDCSTDEAARLVSEAALRYVARGGGPVWTYTHGWREVERSSWGRVHVLASCETPVDVAAAHARGYATALVVEEFESRSVYEWLSAPRDADIERRGAETQAGGSANATGSPATEVGGEGRSTLAPDGSRGGARDGGSGRPLRVLPCPAQTTAGVSCSTCRLCMDSERLRAEGLTIGFALHGVPVTIRRATAALRTPGDPDRKLSSRVLIPRFEEAFVGEHGRRPNDSEVARALGMSPSSVWEMRKSIALGAPARPARRGKRRRAAA